MSGSPVKRTAEQLRRDARAIWQAGVEAVRAERLIHETVRVEHGDLWIRDMVIPLDAYRRLVVVGGGKAAAGMSAALEEVLGPDLLEAKQVAGWVNVPDDCVRPLRRIHLHGGRPAGRNEPTPRAVEGTRRILEIVASLDADDLCLGVISGGGSALLPAPREGITLDDKLAVTRHLSAAGANIQELNTVRKQLSRIKGGGLARACHAGRLAALMISDVIGDPLDLISSGPTVEDHSTAQQALEILERYHARQAGVGQRVFDVLRQPRAAARAKPVCQVTNTILGNNATAVDAAGREAVRLGYAYVLQSATQLEGPAEEVARRLAAQAVRMREDGGPDCLVSGGEPIVHLAPESRRGLGGRNQQLALAALEYLGDDLREITLLSGGTDGEDGPTDAAGALVDWPLSAAARQRGFDAGEYLRRNDAYHFFEPLGGLIKTGPTHTNVGDLRVVLVARRQSAAG